jgi:hypothetical protein
MSPIYYISYRCAMLTLVVPVLLYVLLLTLDESILLALMHDLLLLISNCLIFIIQYILCAMQFLSKDIFLIEIRDLLILIPQFATILYKSFFV